MLETGGVNPSSIIMTVVSVVGSINGHDVVCTKKEDDFWDCNPGDTSDGRYVSEFWATDDAGNIGYRLAILYIYDGRCVKIEWIEDEVSVKYINDNFDVVFVSDYFDITVEDLDSFVVGNIWDDLSQYTWGSLIGVKWEYLAPSFISVPLIFTYINDGFDISIAKCEGAKDDTI